MSKYILKLARCIQELERIKGVNHGGDRKSDEIKTTKCRLDQNPQIIIELVSDNLSLTELNK